MFQFDDDAYKLGSVNQVDSSKVTVFVKREADLKKASVGHLAVMRLEGALESWLVGIIGKVTKARILDDPLLNDLGSVMDEDTVPEQSQNAVMLSLVGTVKQVAGEDKYIFTRSILTLPDIECDCYVLKHSNLEKFMSLLSKEGEAALELGKYTMDEGAAAYLDGNKFFQRHAAILGSTGSGKSWTVASILEKAAKLPSANLIVFDLHGEYRDLSYTSHYRIPGPEDIGREHKELLYLPYWLLNAEELQSMFIDRSEFSAHNQVMVFQDLVIEEKKAFLQKLGKTAILNSFTLDSPVPFDLDNVMTKLIDLNEEMEQGARGLKQGKFNGQFSRLLVRLRSKRSDKRYGFIFQASAAQHTYEAMDRLADTLMSFGGVNKNIKVIDFSEVPSDILPIIVGLVARIVYQVQFWTIEKDRHPLAFICDEAHLYLPKRAEQNPVEKRAVEAFEKIAKEGRKYGVSLVVVSQRPSDVSTTILSQCNNIISLRLSNAEDQTTVKKLMPESLEGIMDVLPVMEIGEALVVGDAVLLPTRIRVVPPNEPPRSATIDFWTEWMKTKSAVDLSKSVENMRKQGRG